MRWKLLVTSLIILGVGLGIGFVARNRRVDPLPVSVHTVAKSEIVSDVRAIGKLVSAQQREIRGEKTFLISKVFVKEGESVHRDQPLALIANSQWLEDLLARYKDALVEVEVAQKALDLSKELLDRKAIPRQQFEEAQVRMQKNRTLVASTQREVQMARQSLALAERSQAPPFLIQSTQDGTVTRLILRAGELLLAEPKEPLVVIADMDQLHVVAEVNPLDIAKVQVDQRVEFSLPFQARTLTGRVVAIASEVTPGTADRSQPSSGVQPSSTSIRVICRLETPNPMEGLKLGLTGEVRIITVIHENALLVPIEAILSEGPIRFVYLAKGGRAERREVKIGISNRDSAEVLEGLQPGEKVVTKGQFLLTDHVPVQIEGR